MFDNLLFQPVKSTITNDVKNKKLPNSLLFFGPAFSGKLTCALELARVLRCENSGEKGNWRCTCEKCKKNLLLSDLDVVLCGPRECFSEIACAKDTFLRAFCESSEFLNATRFLFLRAVRKLTMRFSQILWEGDEKLSKIAVFTREIDENLEILKNEECEFEDLKKICDKIQKTAEKLEKEFLSDTISISQIRRISSWARLKSSGQKKIVILENAEKMSDGAKNAVLKILEEPPEQTIFLLITQNKNAILPTILSRVRLYEFFSRRQNEEKEIITRVFHPKFDFSFSENALIENYLSNFLGIDAKIIQNSAKKFYDSVKNGQIVEISKIIKECGNFDRKIVFKMFLNFFLDEQKSSLGKSEKSFFENEVQFSSLKAAQNCFEAVNVYNLSINTALEKFFCEIFAIRKKFGRF